MSKLRIGTRQLRQDLAVHLRRASSGEQVIITGSGRPIAILGPVHDSPSHVTLEALFATGALVPPRRQSQPNAGEPIAVWSGVRLDRAFREVRG